MRDVNRAKSDKGLQVELNLAEKVFQKIKQDLGIGILVFAVGDQSLLNFHVNFTSHLGWQVSRSVLVQPFLSQNVQDFCVVLVFETLRIEFGVRVDLRN